MALSPLECIKEHDIHIMSWNVNNDRRIELPGLINKLFPELLFSARLQLIMTTICSINPDIMLLQEMNQEGVQIMKQNLEKEGYTVAIGAYCDNPLAFWHLTAWSSRFERLEAFQRYFTRTPTKPTSSTISKEDKLANNFGEEFEKSTLIVTLRERETGRIMVLSNNHFGLRNPYKQISAELLVAFLRDYTTYIQSRYSKPELIIGGDFNTFENDTHKQMISDYASCVSTCALSKDLTGTIGSEMFSSFAITPYDLFGLTKEANEHLTENPTEIREHPEMLSRDPFCGILDHVFSSMKAKNKFYFVPDVNVFDNKEKRKHAHTQALKEHIPLTPSDHLPLVVDLICQN